MPIWAAIILGLLCATSIFLFQLFRCSRHIAAGISAFGASVALVVGLSLWVIPFVLGYNPWIEFEQDRLAMIAFCITTGLMMISNTILLFDIRGQMDDEDTLQDRMIGLSRQMDRLSREIHLHQQIVELYYANPKYRESDSPEKVVQDIHVLMGKQLSLMEREQKLLEQQVEWLSVYETLLRCTLAAHKQVGQGSRDQIEPIVRKLALAEAFRKDIEEHQKKITIDQIHLSLETIYSD